VSGEGADDREPGARGRRERPAVPAYQRALGLLVRREHSATELKRKLRGKGVEVDELDAAVETLQRQGFQDDRRYAEALVRSRAVAGQGPVRIRAELRVNGVPGADIDAAIDARTAELLGAPLPIATCWHPAGPPRCWCRKPLPGLGLRLARAHGIALARSIVVGHVDRGPSERGLAVRLGATYLEADRLPLP